MQSLSTIRNVGIIAHIDAGKTSTTEGMLFYSGLTHRFGRIDDGTTAMDYLDEERSRGITIVAAAATIPWGDNLIHLIDTPGHIDFTAEVERSVRVSDGAVVIFSGVEGVEAQSEKVWNQAARYHVPKIAFVNKLDRVGASFPRVYAEIREKFGDAVIAIQCPVGIEDRFKGMIDLLTMEMLLFEGDDNQNVVRSPIPDESMEEAQAYREELLERIADHSDVVAEKYLEGDEIPRDMLQSELRRLTIAGECVPVMLGSAKMRLGVQPLMDAVISYLPAPDETGPVQAHRVKDEEPIELTADENEAFAGLIFKVVASTSADLLYMRTYTGTLKAGAKLVNSRTRETVVAKQLLRLFAKNTESVDQVGPGDIVGIIGPRGCGTGDTLCEPRHLLSFEPMAFPEPVISMALEPKSSRDKDRLDESLELLCREDPTLHVDRDKDTGQRLISGMGELHLEINFKRLESELNVEVRAGAPRVAYRECFKSEATLDTMFHKFIGDNEIQAGVKIRFATGDMRGQDVYAVSNDVKTPGLPKNLVKRAEEALLDGLKTGGSQGYPLIYAEAELLEIEFFPEKTDENAVVGAVLQAVNEAVTQIGTKVLEPVMRLEILTPEESVGEITCYLQPRRAVIQAMEQVGELKRIECEVPLAEMFGFGKALPKLTGGRASFSMEPCGYQLLQT